MIRSHRCSPLGRLGPRGVSCTVASAALSLMVAMIDTSPATAQVGTAEAQVDADLDPRAQLEQTLIRMQTVNTMMIRASELAEARALNPTVRDLAQRLERDHHFASTRVLALAVRMGFDLKQPTRGERIESRDDLRATLTHSMTKLQRAGGAEFDQIYLAFMEQAHLTAVDELSHARRTTFSDQLRTLLERMVPIFEQHVTLAQRVQQRTAVASRR